MEEQIQRNAAEAAETPGNDKEQGLGEVVRPFPASYPGGITPDTLFDERTERIVKAQADRMVAGGSFVQHERDDIENRLRIVLAYEMADFDPSKDRYTFAATVLAKRGTDMIRQRSRHPEQGYSSLSLNERAGDGTEFVDLISDEDYHEGWGHGGTARGDVLDRLTAELLGGLNDEDRSLCEMIMAGRTFREIAVELGLPVATVHWRFANHVAPAARELGLDRFWEEDEA